MITPTKQKDRKLLHDIVKYLQSFWSNLSVSDSFVADPYGYVGNQAGHFLVGMTFCIFLSSFLPWWASMCAVCSGYLVFELTKDGWRTWDTFEDVGYVSFGAIIIGPAADIMWWWCFVWIVVLAVCLFLGVLHREQEREDD